MSEVCPDIYDEEYKHQFQTKPTYKIHQRSRKAEFKNTLSWNISQIITKTVSLGRTVRVTVRDPSRKVNHLSKVV